MVGVASPTHTTPRRSNSWTADASVASTDSAAARWNRSCGCLAFALMCEARSKGPERGKDEVEHQFGLEPVVEDNRGRSFTSPFGPVTKIFFLNLGNLPGLSPAQVHSCRFRKLFLSERSPQPLSFILLKGEKKTPLVSKIESPPATMAKAPRAGGATPPSRGLPEEIVIWEILTRLSPRSLLRCRAVCRDWLRGTSTRDFLLAHHGRQPSLPVVCSSGYGDARHEYFFAFDHRAADARLQPIARLEDSSCLEASCDGLLILSNHGAKGTCYSVSNMAARQHAPLRQLSGFDLLGMYSHRATNEYRLLLQRTLTDLLPEDQVGCYIFALRSDQPLRYIGGPVAAASTYLHTPALMRAPDVPGRSCIFEMDATLGIYCFNKAMQTVRIWVLQNYESEVVAQLLELWLPGVSWVLLTWPLRRKK
ncbi:hypothetical protein ACQ4PT_058765 [Festuca glaucescens]